MGLGAPNLGLDVCGYGVGVGEGVGAEYRYAIIKEEGLGREGRDMGESDVLGERRLNLGQGGQALGQSRRP